MRNDRKETLKQAERTVPPGTVPDKLQPNDVDAEEALLGALLIDRDSVRRVAPLLDPADFFVERYGWLYDAIRSLDLQNIPADIVTLTDEMTRRQQLKPFGGTSALVQLINRCPYSTNADYYANIIKDKSLRRQLINSAGGIARLAFSDDGDITDVLAKSEEMIFAVTSRKDGKESIGHIRQALQEHMDRIDYLQEHQGQLCGLPTGLNDLDRMLGGLQRSDMVILAGRPGMGKTSFALSIGLFNARKFQKRVGIFSLEMSKPQLLDRLISAESGIDSQRLRNGQIHKDEYRAYIQANGKLADMSIFIDDTPALTPLDLRSRARRLQAEYGIDLLILDYLQLMEAGKRGENRQQEITQISRSIKALARELNIPVLALSQLSRAVESRNDKRPILSDLRESGSIEQDADVVMFIYRDDMYNDETETPGLAEIIVAKHRNGPTGTFTAFFKKHLAQFVELEVHRTPLEPIGYGNGRSAK